jgi:hypothetical protein
MEQSYLFNAVDVRPEQQGIKDNNRPGLLPAFFFVIDAV